MSIVNIHVTLNHDVWEVTLNGDSQGRFDTQYEAYRSAKVLARNLGGGVINVHGADGRILERNTVDVDDAQGHRG